MKSIRLSKRLQKQYQQVLEGRAGSWFDRHPYAGNWGSSRGVSGAWQAYLFAKEWGRRAGVDLKRLQGAVLRCDDARCVYLFAKDVPGANVRRLQEAIVRIADPDYVRRFMELPGANRGFLERFLIVAEVMNG